MTCRKLLQLFVLPALLFISQLLFAQDRVITGKVTDANGNGVPGVTVTPRGGGGATQTSSDGTYRITVKSSTTALIFSSVGYGSQEMPIKGNTVDASLNVANTNMNEVVVIGYGTRLKKDLTGSVTNITSKDFNRGVITSAEQLIAGKVAGVQISSFGGEPGSSSAIRIRGGASLGTGGAATNDPLVVIDGVPLEFGGIKGTPNALAMVNPNDIESISILKDASATAIYGARASNGVIIITTKKGKPGKPKFNFSSQYSISRVTRFTEVLTADEFRNYVNTHGTAQYKALLGTANTNWFDLIFKDAVGNEQNLSMSGSLKNMPYRVSAGYLDQDGTLKTGFLRRKTASISLSPSLFKNYLKIDFNVKGSITNSRFANTSAIGSAATFDPTQYVHNAANKQYGNYFEWTDPSTTSGLKGAVRNPLGLINSWFDFAEVKRSIGNIQLDYKLHFFPDLHAKVNLGYDISRAVEDKHIPDSSAAGYKSSSPDPVTGEIYSGYNHHDLQKKNDKLFEGFLNYQKDISSIRTKVDAIAGYSYQDFLTTIYNYADYSNKGQLRPGSEQTYPFDKPRLTLIGYFGRLNLGFNNKYLLTGTVRRDATSRLSEQNRWGWFPSGSFAWRMIDEDFMKGSRVFSDLKLRLGYGITGQQEGVGLYSYLANYSVAVNTGAYYQFGSSYYNIYRPDAYNPNLKWEQTTTYNAGFDYGFISNRITGTLDVYYKKTKDLLNVISQPAGTNFSNRILANVGNMDNYGVELNINTVPVKNKTTVWELNFNASYNKNKITNLTINKDSSYPGVTYGRIPVGTGNTILINSVGYNRAAFYVYQQVYDPQGKPIEGLFVDRNGDGAITDKDLYRYKSAEPKIFLGASSNLNWRKWNAGFVMRANLGHYVFNGRALANGTANSVFNPVSITINNASRDILNTNFTGVVPNYYLSDYYVQNASFLKMDNFYIGYNAGSFLARNTSLRIGANIQNVFTVTKYKGVDPEIFDGVDDAFYPRPRVFAVTANLDF